MLLLLLLVHACHVPLKQMLVPELRATPLGGTREISSPEMRDFDMRLKCVFLDIKS